MNNDFNSVANALKDSVEKVASYLFPNGKKQGIYWATGDVHDTPAVSDGSFKIGLSGKYKGICGAIVLTYLK